MPIELVKRIQIRRQQVCGSGEGTRRQLLTQLHSASDTADDFKLDGMSSLRRDYEDVEVEWDIAVTHERSETLRCQETVKQFFDMVRTIKSIWDPATRTWLRSLPHIMHGEAIPLFENSDSETLEDYQLNPSYSGLNPGKTAEEPDLNFYHLPCTKPDELQKPYLFMPLGRLFVNMPVDNHLRKRCKSNLSRLTRWTGYEVFLRNDLSLWIVFDKKSLNSDAKPWYPVSCSITKPFECIACLLPSLSELERATYENAKKSIENTCQAGVMYIDEVEKSEVKESERDQAEIPSQDALLQTDNGKQRADDTTRADAAQTLPSPLSKIPSDTLGHSQYTLPMSQRDVDTTRYILVSAHDPNNPGMLLLRPELSRTNTENSQLVKLQLDKSMAEVKSEVVDGRTLLRHAIFSPNKVNLNHLLDMNEIQLNQFDGSGETPLSLAIKSRRRNVVKRLLDTEKIDVNLPNEHGQIPLSLALEQRDKAMIKLLLKTYNVYALSEVMYQKNPQLSYAAEIAAKVVNAGPFFRRVLEKYVSGEEVENEDLRRIEDNARWFNEFEILRLLRKYILDDRWEEGPFGRRRQR